MRTNAETFVRRNKDKNFSLIFFDPPYSRDYYSKFLDRTILNLTQKNTVIYIEQSAHDKVIENRRLEMLKTSSTGNAKGTLFLVKP